MARPLTVPARCCLRAAPALPVADVLHALGVSRQRIHVWRKRHGFPGGPTRGEIDTQALAIWLRDRGCHLTFI